MKDDDRANNYWSAWGVGATAADTGTNGVVVYTYPGSLKKWVKANPPVRNNNPANLRYWEPGKSAEARKKATWLAQNRDHALTLDEDGFGVFPDWMTGKRAADDLWDRNRTENGGRMTIREAVTRFTKTGQKQRIGDLLAKAKGYRDRDGNPVNENTPLSGSVLIWLDASCVMAQKMHLTIIVICI